MEPGPDTRPTIARILDRWQPCYDAWDQYCAATKRTDASESVLGRAINSVEERIANDYDVYVDDLGRRFVVGDERFEQDLKGSVDGYLDKLRTLIRSQFESQTPSAKKSNAGVPPPGQTDPRSPAGSNWEREAEQVTQSALRVILNAMDAMAIRLGYVRPSSQRLLNTTNPDLDVEVPYCQGALLIQEGSASFKDIVKQPSHSQYHTCKYCFMEISDFRTKAYNYSLADWAMLASCHVVACRSFQDRRASYRCFGCYSSNIDFVEPSPRAIRDHIRSCTSMHTATMPKPSQQSSQHPRQATNSTPSSSRVDETPRTAQMSPVPNRPSKTNARPEVSRVVASAAAPPAQPPRPSSQFSGQVNGRAPPPVPAQTPFNPFLDSASSSKPADGYSGEFDQLPGSYPTTEMPQQIPSRPARPPPKTPIPTQEDQRRNPFSLFPSKPTEQTPSRSSQDATGNLQWSQPSSKQSPETAKLRRLEAIGIPRGEAEQVLKSAEGDVDRAADMYWRERS